MSINNYAQNSDFNLENLKAPSMPSATIIGTQVNDLNSPKSMKDLETAIFTNYLNSGQSLTVPNNYALEINPFMLSGMKNFDYRSYLNNEPAENMWRNLSLSIATTNKFLIKDSVFTNAVGLSVRTIILNGELSKKVSDAFLLALNQNTDMLKLNVLVRQLIRRCLKDTALKYSTKNLGYCVICQFEKEKFTDDKGNPLTGSDLEEKKKLIEPEEAVIKIVRRIVESKRPVYIPS